MKEKIFEELRRKEFATGHVWFFQEWNVFKYTLPDNERQLFDDTINMLCKEGIFSAEKDGSVFILRLTEKGEAVIYS